mgnify:CR=1 FL=1
MSLFCHPSAGTRSVKCVIRSCWPFVQLLSVRPIWLGKWEACFVNSRLPLHLLTNKTLTVTKDEYSCTSNCYEVGRQCLKNCCFLNLGRIWRIYVDHNISVIEVCDVRIQWSCDFPKRSRYSWGFVAIVLFVRGTCFGYTTQRRSFHTMQFRRVSKMYLKPTRMFSWSNLQIDVFSSFVSLKKSAAPIKGSGI